MTDRRHAARVAVNIPVVIEAIALLVARAAR